MSENRARKPKDLVLVHGRTEDGQGVEVVRSREDRIEAGVMRPLQEGRPLQGEVVKLTPRSECPLLFDAETQLTAGEAAPAHSAPSRRSAGGPPQVASDDYRRNWDAIWKGRRKKIAALN